MEDICCALNFFSFIIICILLPGLRTYQPADKLQMVFFYRVVRFTLVLLLLHGLVLLHLITLRHGVWTQSGYTRSIVIALGILGDIFFFSTLYFYVRFLEQYLSVKVGESKWHKPVAIVTASICMLGIAVLIVTRICHSSGPHVDLFPGSSAYWISHICGYVVTVFCVGLLLRYVKQIGLMDLISLSSFLLLPVVVSVVRVFWPGVHLLAVSGAISIILIFINIHLKQYQTLRENELELSKSQLLLMNSQIQPHFLYNTLNSIYVLCGKDPEQAREAIIAFSEYLRGKVRSWEDLEAIPFEEELELVRHYLLLEKMRFQDELQIVYDIQATNFSLPTLSLQPLVGNAIKHGLAKKPGGGTVTIRSVEKEDCYEVTVLDDGLGPAAAFQEDGSGTHIGMLNTQKRLKLICGGTLQITGSPEIGAEAVIRIPKKRG